MNNESGIAVYHTPEEPTKKMLPRLRFPEFRSAASWRIEKLSQFLIENGRRNRSLEYTALDVLSVSGEHGCVNQISHLGRSYAGASVKEYRVVEKGDLVYTKSPLKKSPFGIIKENKDQAGIVSTLYAVYRPKENADATFFDHYFSRSRHLNMYLRPLVKKGAKNDMKVNNLAALSGYVVAPDVEEQKKIANCLSAADQRILAETKKLFELKAYRGSLAKMLLPANGATQPILRFPDFRQRKPWEPVSLERYIIDHSERAPANTELPIYTSARTGLQPQKDYYDDREVLNEGEYGVVPDGFFVYRHMSDDGAFKFNINNTGRKIAVSKEYPVFRVEGLNPAFVRYLLNEGHEFRSFALAQKKGGTRTRLYLKVLRTFTPHIPPQEEQERISDFLQSFDSLVSIQEERISYLARHKAGLMQRLFPLFDGVQG